MTIDTSGAEIADEEKLLACVHCGLCLQACPTYLETGAEAESPRGRIYLMKALREGVVAPSPDTLGPLDRCLGCRACESACPSGVEYGTLIDGARPWIEERARRGWKERLWRRALASALPNAARLRPLARLTSLAAPFGSLARMRAVPLSLRRWIALRPDLPRVAAIPEVVEPEAASRGTVVFLRGCVASVFFSDVNEATVRLLARAGYRVVTPRSQVCCGALSAHLGDEERARSLAERSVRLFRSLDPDFVVTNAAGCGARLKEYRDLFASTGDGWAAEKISRRARDATELLAEADLDLRRPLEARVAYHDACHLAHGQGVRDEPRALLRSIPGVQLVELGESEVCCGSAGTYNLTEPEMAWRLAARKAAAIRASGAEIVATANPGCLLQIRAAFRLEGGDVSVAHPISLAARALE